MSAAYKILGLPDGASMDEVKKTYRKLAKKWHPDSSTHPEAEVRFSQIAMAYERIQEWEREGRPEDNLAYFLLLKRKAEEYEERKKKAYEKKQEMRKRILKLRRQQDREQLRQYKYAFYLLVGFALVYVTITQSINLYEMYRISSNPAETFAVIEEQDRYTVYYVFYVGDTRYVSDARVRYSRNHNKSLNGMPIQLHDSFKVRYSKDNPEYNEIDFQSPSQETLLRYFNKTEIQLRKLYPSSFDYLSNETVHSATKCVAVKLYDVFGFDGMADLIYYNESFLENGSNNSGTYEDLVTDSRFAQCFSSCNVPIPQEIQDR
ncbi:MAG: J domain-containing protein [Flavobacteriia bacterium]|nr:J domain-containing protein [Flavobacteriia bacterium]